MSNPTPHATALVTALEALNNLPEKTDEDTRAKALIRVDVARREVIATSSEAERESFSAVLDAMNDMPDIREMVARHGRYIVKRRPGGFSASGPFFEVFQVNDVQFDLRRYIRKGLIALLVSLALSLVLIGLDPSSLIGYGFLGVAILAPIGGTWIAVSDGKEEAERQAEKSVAEVHLLKVSQRYGVNLDEIGTDHPDLAQWLLDYASLPSSCPAHIEADMKRRLKEMAESPMAATRIESSLYELRHGVERQLPATPSIPKNAASTIRRKVRR